MKLLYILFLLTLSIASWSKEDYEIFSLNDNVKNDLGNHVDFYSWLNLTKGPNSNLKEITKAYRKLSRNLHPDKYKYKDKKIEERFQRLSLVGNILRDQSLKKRYDYFYSKGFPKWKGTGYYYSKFRPGFLFTLLILFIITNIFHFFALKINRKQAYKRIENLRDQIKSQAWNNSNIPPTDGSDRKVTNEQNGQIFLVKNDGSVYLDGEHLVDPNEINTNPGFKETLAFKLFAMLYNSSIGRVLTPIDTTINYVKPDTKPHQQEQPVSKKKKNRGKKIELPNGKIIYSRK